MNNYNDYIIYVYTCTTQNVLAQTGASQLFHIVLEWFYRYLWIFEICNNKSFWSYLSIFIIYIEKNHNHQLHKNWFRPMVHLFVNKAENYWFFLKSSLRLLVKVYENKIKINSICYLFTKGIQSKLTGKLDR